MYSGVAPWSIANLWCNRKIHGHGFTRIDADLKSPKAACCKASHASADPEEIASNEFVAKISTCKHRKCRRAAFVASVLEIRQTHRPPSQLVRENKKPARPDGNVGFLFSRTSCDGGRCVCLISS